ncbi:transposase (plasmid) [Moraxella osloensis]|nr:transposase [Moraxella osloensis]
MRINQTVWLESGGVYGYRKIHYDLKDIGEGCGINRVHRLMKQMVSNLSVAIANPDLRQVHHLLLPQTH